jgi:hypothetical protein
MLNDYTNIHLATISTNIRRRPVGVNLPYEPTVQEVQHQIGDLYRIPKAVRDEGALLASAYTSRLYQNIQQPLLILMEYNEFMHMKERVVIAGVRRIQDVDLFERYWVRNDLLPGLDD